jgi:regulatory protein
VARETADEALAEVDPESERKRATELVARKLRGVSVSGPDERARAGRRLVGMLARRGYPAGLSYEVVRTALTDRGAEDDELGPADLG